MRYIVTLLVTDDIPETIQAECTVEKQSIIDVGNGHRGIVCRVESVTIATQATPLLTMEAEYLLQAEEEEDFGP